MQKTLFPEHDENRMTFKDHFSETAAGYVRFRPRYPETLFHYLADAAPRRVRAWDCATGSGQAAIGLAKHFERVIATDASAGQIAHALPNPRVDYRVAPAEKSGLEPESVDLVTVAQALHWFDIPAFFQEVKRVLVPGGLLAVWCYQLFTIDPEIDRIVLRFYTETVGRYWPPERKMIEEGYRSISFPSAFTELRTPSFSLESPLTLDQFGGFLQTWSAVQRCNKEKGRDPVAPLLAELAPLWGDLKRPRMLRYPLPLRMGRKEEGP